jgi:hypothetical protein
MQFIDQRSSREVLMQDEMSTRSHSQKNNAGSKEAEWTVQGVSIVNNKIPWIATHPGSNKDQ